jgi:hypothetical protein
MHGRSTGYVVVAGGALSVGLVVAGTPLPALLPYALLLACPLMMVLMMRSMGRHGTRLHGPVGDRDATRHPRPGSRERALAGRQDDRED